MNASSLPRPRPWLLPPVRPALILTAALALLPAAAPAPPVRAAEGPPLSQLPPQVLPLTARWCLPPSPSGEGRCIALEVPRGARQYAMGLQRRPPLPPLRGMWFPYDPPQPARFWMHQTPSPLDMLFVGADGRVIAIEAAAPPCPHLPCRSYGPEAPLRGVLELAAGEAARLGITVGMPVRIEPLAPQSPPAGAAP